MLAPPDIVIVDPEFNADVSWFEPNTRINIVFADMSDVSNVEYVFVPSEHVNDADTLLPPRTIIREPIGAVADVVIARLDPDPVFVPMDVMLPSATVDVAGIKNGNGNIARRSVRRRISSHEGMRLMAFALMIAGFSGGSHNAGVAEIMMSPAPRGLP